MSRRHFFTGQHQRRSGSGLKPPPGLRGKELGLWFAAHSGKNRNSELMEHASLDLAGVNSQEIVKVLSHLQESGFLVPNSEASTSTKSLDSSGSSTGQLQQRFSDSINLRSESATSPPFIKSDRVFPSLGNLPRNTNLDSSLTRTLIAQENSPSYMRMLEFRKTLPAYAMKKDILSTIETNQVVVISGETGCGKTTQIPQLVLEDEIARGNGSITRIVVTQPRRISAISVAERVAAERGERIGQSIGYQVRLERCQPQRMPGSIMFLTTGTLLQWLQSDRLLENVSHVFVDEVHEREFLGDFLLTVLRDLARVRPNLRIVIMSATMNADKFSTYFDGCPKLEIPGRTYPVETFFLEDVLRMTNFWLPAKELDKLTQTQQSYRARRFVDSGLTKGVARKAARQTHDGLVQWIEEQTGLSSAASKILRAVDQDAYPNTDLIIRLVDHIMNQTKTGAILVFVPGAAAIREVISGLRAHDPNVYGESNHRVKIYPLHSLVSLTRQRGLFDLPPPNQRKIIVATNIAETSITIPDVVYVIDCGRIKMTDYDPTSNTNMLAPVLVSRANAAQRRGRAGRVQNGFCYHLFTRYVHDNVMSDFTTPEMLRMRLEDVILRIKLLGLGPVSTFLHSCISPPEASAVERTLHFLEEIQALDLTKIAPNASQPQPTDDRSRKPSRRQLRNEARAAKEAYNATGELPSSSSTPQLLTNEYYGELPGDCAGLSPLGVHLAQLPMDPQLAKLLILGALFGCLEPALAVAASLNYRNPFEIPLDQEVSALNRRRELSQNNFSDHWVFVTVLKSFRLLTNPSARRLFCDQYLLRENVLRDILSLMQDYATLLYERQYISSPDPWNAAANINTTNFPIFRAILCGSLFPNLMKLVPKVKNGSVVRPTIHARPMEGRVQISPMSINENIRPSNDVWAVYFQKTRLDSSTAVVLDTTIVPLRPVLFFSGMLQPDPKNPSVFTVDNWITVQTSPTVFRILQSLRHALDQLLESKYRHPSVTDWDPAGPEGMLLRTIIDLLVSERVPLIHTQRKKPFADSDDSELDQFYPS